MEQSSGTIALFKIKKHVIKRAVQLSLKQWVPVTLSTIAFIVFSPVMGGLGGFLTGSNVASNAILINLQVEVTKQIGMSPELVASVQTASSAHMTMIMKSHFMYIILVGGGLA